MLGLSINRTWMHAMRQGRYSLRRLVIDWYIALPRKERLALGMRKAEQADRCGQEQSLSLLVNYAEHFLAA